ncbi:MAG: spermidine/putrescine ABC transporter ATP-binding protein [Firmicutes bacterium HGW-Firmicutes-1]|nr:MAG: spermidine/putrescine ABC transporter ATP-binding protein [Firmicutes bacterium HGW-Firmicutes-1]
MIEYLIQLNNISKSYENHVVLDHLNLSIRKNEFLTLLGPSGCGKTTTLRMIGGFEMPDSGNIIFDNIDITKIPPYKRNINTVFQKYALFQHLNIYENVAFGLRIQKMSEAKIREKVSSTLKLVNLDGFEKRDISSLSGGQQQRVAIARAVVNEPEVLLLDEPLGALDLKLRKEMQIELKKWQQELGITFVYVTHDQEEALAMSDTVVVLNNGIIQQMGIPEHIYNEPSNAFVADFIGESNIIDGIMKKDYVVQFLNTDFQCTDLGFKADEIVDVVIRPEDVEIVNPENAMIIGKVTSVIFKGVHFEMTITTGDFTWLVQSTLQHPVGSEVGIRVIPFNIHVMKKVV